jgi:enoyl-CoA hydratase/carnithine racemase
VTADPRIQSAAAGAVGTLIFSNPERHNAVSLEMWRAAAGALGSLIANPEVRVIVVTGAGGKAFVSGADITKFASERATPGDVASYNDAVERFSQALIDSPKPTIAMIRGYCIGGGVGIAVCCDLRICNETARFAVPAAKLGVGYTYENIRRLMDVIRSQFVNEMLFTARQLHASEALQIGLVNRVAPDASIEREVQDLAAAIAENAPLTIQSVKTIVRELRRDPANRDVALCESLVQRCFESEDYREGWRAFLEKRKPVFSGR